MVDGERVVRKSVMVVLIVPDAKLFKSSCASWLCDDPDGKPNASAFTVQTEWTTS